ncbi:MAG: ethylbenzene dehydrogenase-related protein [Planctomycetota bacterium]
MQKGVSVYRSAYLLAVGLVCFGLIPLVLGGCPPTGGGGGNINNNTDNTNANDNGNGNANDNGNDNVDNDNDNVPQVVPTLEGLEANKAMILPIQVQAAYNDDTMFFQISWEGDRGDTHDYVRYVEGAWRKEGGHRRDGQATLDNDPLRGATDLNSTIYESRVTFMIDDPNGPNAVPGFAQVGCMLTCHDSSRVMPLWKPEDGDVTKYLNPDTAGTIDLWHHRLGRANPIGASDDQNVTQIPEGGETGGRFGDEGDSPWQTNDIDETTGDPKFAFDPATTAGLYAFKFADTFFSPMRFFRRDDAPENGAEDVPVGIDFAEAVAMGYVPAEDDTIPFRRLRQPTASRGDITAYGTTFTPSADDPLFGRWRSNTQRLLNTGNADDTALADANVYNIHFAVHVGKVTVRDHYVSFSYTISLNGGAADIQAVKVAGNGRDAVPDFSDTSQFPVTELNLFLPGITSWEFLTGENTDLTFVDPATDETVDQFHGGATFILQQGLGCRDCHTAATGDTFAPVQQGGFNAGAMETQAPQRGGVNTPTPIPPAGPG